MFFIFWDKGSAANAEDGGRTSPTIYDGDRLVELVGKGLCFTAPETQPLTVQLAKLDGARTVQVTTMDRPGGAGGDGDGNDDARAHGTAAAPVATPTPTPHDVLSPTASTTPSYTTASFNATAGTSSSSTTTTPTTTAASVSASVPYNATSRPATAAVLKTPAVGALAAPLSVHHGTNPAYAATAQERPDPGAPASVGTAWTDASSNGSRGPVVSARRHHIHRDQQQQQQQQRSPSPARRSLTAIDHIRATVAQANAVEQHAVRSQTGYGTVMVAPPRGQPAQAHASTPTAAITTAPAPAPAPAHSVSHRSEKPQSSYYKQQQQQQQQHEQQHRRPPQERHEQDHPPNSSQGRNNSNGNSNSNGNGNSNGSAPSRTRTAPPSAAQVHVPSYQELSRLVDSQAIRAAEFSPSGSYLAIGSNSAQIRVCLTPVRRDADGDLEWGRQSPHEFGGQAPLATLSTVWNQKKYHRGSIYCIRWNRSGDVVATGSNDKMVQLQRFDGATCSAAGTPSVIKPHAGTVRSLAFVEGGTGSELVVTGGGGDFSIGAFDCSTGQSVARMVGHTGAVNALAAVRGHAGLVASASADGTVKLWDARAGLMSLSFAAGSSGATAIAASGVELAVGREDGSISLLDSRTGYFTHSGTSGTSGTNSGGPGPHEREVKSLQYAPVGAHRNLLLSCSYDGSVGISQAGVGGTLKTKMVAWHDDKVISARWCPLDTGEAFPGFVTASADRTVKIWTPASA